MHCVICSEEFNCLKKLFMHLKILHGCDKKSNLKCFEKSCQQIFNGLPSYKKHLSTHLRNLDTIEIEPPLNMNSTHDNLSTKAGNSSSIFENMIQNNPYSSNEQELPVSNGSAEKIQAPLQSIIENSILQFVLSQYNNNNFSRKDAFTIQKAAENFIISPLLDIVLAIEMCEEDKKKIENVVKEYRKVINELNTEYKLEKFLENRDLFKKPKEFDINREISHIMKNGQSILEEKVEKGILMDLKFEFRKIFEKPENQEVLTTFLDEHSKPSNIRNFINGELWKQKKAMYENKKLVPYYLFTDDFEVNNPLGAHSGVHKLTGIYFSIPIFENYFKVSDIYLAGLIKAHDIKTYGNDLTIYNLVQEIISLEIEGIDLILNGQKTTICLVMGLILGDNLGLNQILEFSKSFSSNYYCRFCIAPIASTKVMCKEDSTLIRTEENYDENLSKDFSSTGVYKNSILNKIPSFHVVTNFSVDLMHDIFEGVAHYNLTHVIQHYIKNKVFTLAELNEYKLAFSYGDTEKGNVFKDITVQHLKRKRLNASAREMWTFIHHFPLMIGHLIPVNDEVWEFIIIFIKMIDILLLPQCNDSKLDELEHLIEKHNELYQNLFGDTLKPKHHNLIHYPRIIRYSGLPKFYWSFLFEAKHQELKSYSRVTSSRKNILLSIATKFQFKFAYQITKPRDDFLQFSHHDEISSVAENISDLSFDILNLNSKHFEKIEYLGTVYKKGSYLSITNNLNVIFFIITRIIILDANRKIYMLCQEIPTIFNDHYIIFQKKKNLY
ncbi:uncharacterized protein LOC129919101 isoform X1 [Episyrphus balteatus]|uniref:uncharacterized protein LOC129919101 isoform X1 n=1 Tax=Episyrphus balteatus TaxID=286459 RepID=UPI002486BE49|nr:uncharacterized protein LOC129919101 isoform X1 [Episyrphus balteatus]XP_055855911.1 uncharacterized protein LOC129919101 isoform X1 [Episyrphus balteatus]XP_055855912.1 uncharacterized protein LOC129919101 isoform X1 [Episyrphus balteatus]XP_055855913.1 uncharacterized protein LOC129919101 isoform X1 [Episyrphus balteatus]XP_055855914.1 uncharacterized protein LOC129919101 isoform X1 [Episyrphus balteatus]